MESLPGLIIVALSVYTFYFMQKVVKATQIDTSLTKNEKIQVIILLLLNTLISVVILYFGWKNKLPTKAKQVNTYLVRIIGALVGIAILAFILTFVFAFLSKSR